MSGVVHTAFSGEPKYIGDVHETQLPHLTCGL